MGGAGAGGVGAGRRVLVYATHTGTRDITERMDVILTPRVPGGGDEGGRGGPRPPGGLGRR